MTKALVIEPKTVFSRDVVHLSDIPENTYQKTVKEESSLYTPKGPVDIWRDMCAIRESRPS